MSAIEASAVVPVPAAEAFELLDDLGTHWRLADRWIEVVRLDAAAPGEPPHGGVVRLRGPFGLRRTATTVVRATAPGERIEGTAQIGARTRARITWTLAPAGPHATLVRLAATLERAAPLDRALLALGGRLWLRRRFAATLRQLAAALAGERPVVALEPTPGFASAPPGG